MLQRYRKSDFETRNQLRWKKNSVIWNFLHVQLKIGKSGAISLFENFTFTQFSPILMWKKCLNIPTYLFFYISVSILSLSAFIRKLSDIFFIFNLYSTYQWYHTTSTSRLSVGDQPCTFSEQYTSVFYSYFHIF